MNFFLTFPYQSFFVNVVDVFLPVWWYFRIKFTLIFLSLAVSHFLRNSRISSSLKWNGEHFHNLAATHSLIHSIHYDDGFVCGSKWMLETRMNLVFLFKTHSSIVMNHLLWRVCDQKGAKILHLIFFITLKKWCFIANK